MQRNDIILNSWRQIYIHNKLELKKKLNDVKFRATDITLPNLSTDLSSL